MGIVITGGKGSTDASPKALSKGVHSSAEGTATASGDRAHAEGRAIAPGTYSHAEGDQSQADGTASHAEGTTTWTTGSHSHAEGIGTQAAGIASHSEGSNTTAAGDDSHAEGTSTIASTSSAHAEGQTCTASGTSSHAQGVRAVASRYGQHSQAGGYFAASGDAQASTFVASKQTTDATPTTLTFQTGVAVVSTILPTTNVLTIPASRAHQFNVSVVARRSDVSADTAGWSFSGLIGRGSSGSAAFVGTVDGRAWGAAGAAAWDVTLTIDTTDATNNYLKISVTGEAAKTIRWVARIETVEVG